ncbi:MULTISPECIES: ribosome maturation factor RimM [Eubacterium]|jgi:16S rRNA processing protein RimM|uniref:Ribosome maturation factor RimM n=1 Tax=Eubacterium album TaxID=2978477 RepID=A0ABT2M1C2_9FIRM|nr:MULTISPECIES: ribosome maturation factor RimM [unclassified Eubacterium (in: firmicutes)]MCJ7966024.1 ribosome maturation factor RimM [Lachnospiraceae bacterium NSJ-171]MEE0294931.1 ribosome maturation factor RimM [Eubacterium sp.]CDA29027.1 ribosome maturation factor RimM [Eubacterium sp. CAG:156]MCT7399311.1 ribosome maturation factor RimM [Eubacterium sp. LFL-14]RGG66710.1 ribosome maturation factor RimM [Eubacterium sp. AF17-7]
MEKYFRVGVIANTHGIRGEVKVYPTTDDINRFKKLKKCILDTGKEYIDLNVESVKFFKNMVILKFKEYNNINDIECYKGKDILVSRDNAVKLEKGEYYIADILGAKVILEDGSEFGVLEDVMQTGANDVYVVKTLDNKEVLLPKIDECVKKLDIENKIVTVHIMKGLLD